ncbi:hypothetical protein BGZ82_000543 [Podila clonocystis]|nr:hypothetical protein BGZ82_000543 [Podila clonocystis]
MSTNYRGKNFDPNYQSRRRSNNNGYSNNNNNNNTNNISNSNSSNGHNHNPQSAKRKRPNKQLTGRSTNNSPNSNINRNQHNNYYDGDGSKTQRIVMSPSSSFGEQSDIVESDSESEASAQSSEQGSEPWSQGQGKPSGPGVNGSNYRGPPEKYDPNYHKNKWKRARSSSGDPHDEGTRRGPSFNGVVENATYGTYQNSMHQPTNSALVSSAVPTFAAVPMKPHAGMGQEAQLAKLFGLVIPVVPRSTSQSHGGQNADVARHEHIKADIKEQLALEIQQLEKEQALAVREKRDDDALRVDFEILWRGAEIGYYQKAFHRADTISHSVEKYKYLLELQIKQNEARLRMEDRMKRETPSALRAIMDGSSTATNQTTIQAGSASTSTSIFPQRAFVPTPVPSSLNPQAGLVGSDVQVKVEPSEPTASIGAPAKPFSTPSRALRSTTTDIAPSAQASTAPTVPAATTFQTSLSPAFAPVSSFSSGVSAAPANPFLTFTPTVPSSPFNFSSNSNSSPFAFGQTSSTGLATSTSTPLSNSTRQSAPKATSVSGKESTSSTTVATTPTVTTRPTTSLPSVVPAPPHLHKSTNAVELPGYSSKAGSEPTQGTTKPSSVPTTTLPTHTLPVLHSTVPAPASGSILSSASSPAPALVPAPTSVPIPAPVTTSPHNVASLETRSVPVSASPATDGHGRRSSAVDNLASLVLASARGLIPADLDKQITKLQEDNRDQTLKFEKLQRMVESETRRREIIEKQVSEYQVDLQSSRITALEKDLECRRAEAVEMMAKAREERLQAREETAKARQGQAEAREEVAKVRLGQAEATLRATKAEAENQRLWNWFEENESRLGSIPPPPRFGTTPSLTMTLEGPSATTSPLSTSLDRTSQPAPLDVQPLATVDGLATSVKLSGSVSDESDMDLESEIESHTKTRPHANLAAPV